MRWFTSLVISVTGLGMTPCAPTADDPPIKSVAHNDDQGTRPIEPAAAILATRPAARVLYAIPQRPPKPRADSSESSTAYARARLVRGRTRVPLRVTDSVPEDVPLSKIDRALKRLPGQGKDISAMPIQKAADGVSPVGIDESDQQDAVQLAAATSPKPQEYVRTSGNQKFVQMGIPAAGPPTRRLKKLPVQEFEPLATVPKLPASSGKTFNESEPARVPDVLENHFRKGMHVDRSTYDDLAAAVKAIEPEVLVAPFAPARPTMASPIINEPLPIIDSAALPMPKRLTHQPAIASARPAMIQRVTHHVETSKRDQVAHVTDLEVEYLPKSSRRVIAPAQFESVTGNPQPKLQPSKSAAIPLQKVPTSDRASIERHADLVTLIATDADLRNVLRMIADHHRLNLVIGPEVSGPVTVSLRGARLEEVLSAILGVAGFHWHQEGNLLYITASVTDSLDPKVQGRRLQVYPLNYVAARDVEDVVNGLLSPVGKAFTSQADSEDQLKTQELLVIEDIDAGHRRIAQYIAQVDMPPQQVLVEAHVLQIDLDDEERHGVNLKAIARISGARVILDGARFAEETPDGPSLALRVDGTDIDQLIEAIHVNTNSRTLASPKVSVVNRQTAKVQIGQRLPYAVATTTQTATIQNVQFLDVGIVLEVTPVITADRNILMTVLPKVSGGRISESGFPEEDTTQVSTTVLMPDGSGLVIGGLIREADTHNVATVPKLSRVPVIKHLFTKRQTQSRRNELVVALVTHIVDCAAPVRNKERGDLQNALPVHAASELLHRPAIQHIR